MLITIPNRKWGSLGAGSFFELQVQELNLRVFLKDCTVAMATYYTKKITGTSSPMAGHLFDTNIAE